MIAAARAGTRSLALACALGIACPLLGNAVGSVAPAVGALALANAAAAPFTAGVDRTRIGQDESVSLKFSFESDGSARTAAPVFQAPDFEVVNEYSGNFTESFYDGSTGQFRVKHNQSVTKVLRPLRQGALRIRGIRLEAGGQTYSAPDITVVVTPPGAGSPPSGGFGGGGPGVGTGLRGSGQRINAPAVMVRAEIDKSKVVKGEQVIVSYYIYTRVKTFNISVDKFPVLKGFLREDLEMPVLSHLDTEQVTVDGLPYRRSLLARYAAYPLEEGELKIDSMALKYNYYAPQGGGLDDGEDPFLNFFQQLTPRNGQSRSDQISVQVSPLPIDGKPASFTGGVGDFNVASAVDKYDVPANQAVTLTFKIEGRGNVAAIGEPRVKWPADVELYDSKTSAKSSPGGVGEKDFEYLLIPRTPGRLQLPAMEMSFFDPNTRQYVTRRTEPIDLNVLPPAPGSTPPQNKTPANPASGGSGGGTNAGAPAIQGLKLPGAASEALAGTSVWTWVARTAITVMLGLLAWMGWDFLRRRMKRWKTANAAGRTRKTGEFKGRWEKLRAQGREAARADSDWDSVTQTYDGLHSLVLDTLDERYAVGAHGRPRVELREILVGEKGMPEAVWDRLARILEYAETVRFAGQGGGVPALEARAGLEGRIREAEEIALPLLVSPKTR